MKDHNQKLDFNFDDVPMWQPQSADRTPKPAPKKEEPVVRRSPTPGSLLTPSEVMGMSIGRPVDEKPTQKPDEPIEKIPVSRVNPAVEAQPTIVPNGEYSAPALKLLQNMKTREAKKEPEAPQLRTPAVEEPAAEIVEPVAVEPKLVINPELIEEEPVVVEAKPVEEPAEDIDYKEIFRIRDPEPVPPPVKAESTSTSDVSDMARFLGNVTNSEVPEPVTYEPVTAPEPVAVVIEPEPAAESVAEDEPVPYLEDESDSVPVMPIKFADDPGEVVSMRNQKADEFVLDADAVAAGFDSIDIDPTVVMPTVAPAVPSDIPADGGTRMFDSPVNGEIKQEYVPHAVHIPEEFDDEDAGETVIDEYNSVDDAQSVSEDLTRRKRKLAARLFATGLFALLMLIMAFSKNLFPFGKTPYFVATAVLLGLTVIVNISDFQSLGSLFGVKPDPDLAPSLAVFASVLQLAAVAIFGVGELTATLMLAGVSAVPMFASVFAKLRTVSRTLANFELIANEEPKDVGVFIAPPLSASIADPKKVGESLIFGRRTTIDLKNFIANSLSPDTCEAQSGKLSLVIVIAAVIAAIGAAVTSHAVTSAVTAFAAVCCAGAQIAAFYPSAVLLARTCRKLRSKRVMLGGFKAAREISDANVVVLDSDELFNDEGVQLFKFRTFEDHAPDEAFMTAAAIANEGHSPLAGLFNQIAETNGVGMFTADSVIFEDCMGLGGWVNERKVLLGNRMLMEAHSVAVPPIDVDRKILKSGKFPVYLAIDEKPAALFIVGYEADRSMLHSVRRLINTGVTLLVRTVDPNVTSDLVCEAYGLPSGSVEVMSTEASRIYCERMCPSESEQSILYSHDALGFSDAYTSAYSLNRRANVASVTAIVLTCVIVALCIALPVFKLASAINVVTLLASYAVITVLTAIAAAINS